MEKTVIFLSLLSLFFQSLPMDHRVAMKKMHEQYEQPESYKADDRPILDGESQIHHRQHLILDCAGSSGWSKKFVGLALCTMLVCAEAAPILESGSRTSKSHEDDAVTLRQTHESNPFAKVANSTTPFFYDDGDRCYPKSADGGTLAQHILKMDLYPQSRYFFDFQDYCKRASAHINKLINAGMPVDESYNGITPLVAAVKSGFPSVVDALLKTGARADAADEAGLTALDKTIIYSMPLVEKSGSGDFTNLDFIHDFCYRDSIQLLMEHLHLNEFYLKDRVAYLVDQTYKNKSAKQKNNFRRKFMQNMCPIVLYSEMVDLRAIYED